MFRYGHAFHHGPGVFGWLFLALLFALVVVAVVALVRAWASPRGGALTSPFGQRHLYPGGPPMAQSVDPALSELRLRYARGEIDRDEYARRAGDLGYPAPGPGPMPPTPPPPEGP